MNRSWPRNGRRGELRLQAIPAETIKNELTDPIFVCRALGLKTGRRTQTGIWVRCPSPSHEDRHPSCHVFVGKRGTLQAHCFACGEVRGDVFNLIATVYRLDPKRDFPEILEIAKSMAPSTSSYTPPVASPAPHALSTQSFDAIIAPFLTLGALDDSPIARDVSAYLHGRKALDMAVSDGWAALPLEPVQREWRQMAYSFANDASAHFTRADLDGCGLFSDSGFIHPDHRLVIPYRDAQGRVYTVQRRRLDNKRRAYMFPQSRGAEWPYGIERLSAAPAEQPVMLVEGAIDVLWARKTTSENGDNFVVLGVPGAQAWSKMEWKTLVKDREVTIGFDADEHGDKAADALAPYLQSAGARGDVRRATLSGAKDWAELGEAAT